MKNIFKFLGCLSVLLVIFVAPLWFVVPEQFDLASKFLEKNFNFNSFFNLQFEDFSHFFASVYLLLTSKTIPNHWLHVFIIFNGILTLPVIVLSRNINSSRSIAYACIGWLLIISSALAIHKYRPNIIYSSSDISIQLACYAICFLSFCCFFDKRKIQNVAVFILMLSAIITSYTAILQIVPKDRISLQDYAAKERGFENFSTLTNHIAQLHNYTNAINQETLELLHENNFRSLNDLNNYTEKLSNSLDSIDIVLKHLAKKHGYESFQQMTNEMLALWKVNSEIEATTEYYASLSELNYEQLLDTYPKITNLYPIIERIELENSEKFNFKNYQDAEQQLVKLTTPTEQQLIDRLTKNRAFGTFINPNSLAGFLIICIPIFVGLLFSQKSFVVKLAAFIGISFSWVALVASRSKSSLMILGFSLILLIFLSFISKKLKIGWSILLTCFVIVMSMAALNLGYKDNFTSKLKQNGMARLEYYDAAIKMIKANPVKGYGPDGFSKNYLIYAKKDAEFTRLTHNALLNIWVDFGLVAAIGLILVFVFPLLKIFTLVSKDNFDFFRLACLIAFLNFVLHAMVDFDFHILGIVLPGLLAAAIVFIPKKEEM